MDKRFKAVVNQISGYSVWNIIDYEESEKIDGFVIYNDLGSCYFSSAPQLCELLNELDEENKKLKKMIGD